jgi:hypothetical protein
MLARMDLFEELRALVHALRRAGLDYALCGGFALAAHGIVRATEDIDLMVEESDLAGLRAVTEPMGFLFQPRPLLFKAGKVRIYRLIKTQPPGTDFLVLDVLTVTLATRPAWETRRQLHTDLGSIPVVSRAGLILLKKLRRSRQDLDDIQKLRQHETGAD